MGGHLSIGLSGRFTGFSAMVCPQRMDGWWLLPPDRKIVIMGASHTSNWDFLVFLGAVHSLNRKVHFIGKRACFDGRLAASCVPWAVSRSIAGPGKIW